MHLDRLDWGDENGAKVPRLTFGPLGGVTIGFQCLFRCMRRPRFCQTPDLSGDLRDFVREDFDLSNDGVIVGVSLDQIVVGYRVSCIWGGTTPIGSIDMLLGKGRNRYILGGNWHWILRLTRSRDISNWQKCSD